MAKSNGFTLEQVQAIVEDEDLDRAELAEVVQECFSIMISVSLRGLELAKFIYKVYQEKSEEITEVRKFVELYDTISGLGDKLTDGKSAR